MRDELQRLKQENETLRKGEIDDRGLSNLLKRDKGLLQQLAKEVARQNGQPQLRNNSESR